MSVTRETVLQFGAGRFLRAFADRFIQYANDHGQGAGGVVVVQSTPGPRAELLRQQPEGYHVLVRGYEDGKLTERPEMVRSIRRALIAQEEWERVLDVARSPELRYIISNATEAGYTLDPGDRADSRPPRSFPAKLTQVLWHRFRAGAAPLLLLPCELFDNNASRLRESVLGLARNWALPREFIEWAGARSVWLNSLVDCIITSPPPDHTLAATDRLLVCAEPYALWAIERPPGGEPLLFRHPAMQLVDELAPYYLRKVRILNGLHTAMVGKFLHSGFQTVQQVLADREAVHWVRGLLYEEIVPSLAYRVEDVALFADQTWDRLRNPYLSHPLKDIALHHADKVRVRLQPTVSEYERLFGKPPRRLTEAMMGEVRM
jgi:tagaturonate reductase